MSIAIIQACPLCRSTPAFLARCLRNRTLRRPMRHLLTKQRPLRLWGLSKRHRNRACRNRSLLPMLSYRTRHLRQTIHRRLHLRAHRHHHRHQLCRHLCRKRYLYQYWHQRQRVHPRRLCRPLYGMKSPRYRLLRPNQDICSPDRLRPNRLRPNRRPKSCRCRWKMKQKSPDPRRRCRRPKPSMSARLQYIRWRQQKIKWPPLP